MPETITMQKTTVKRSIDITLFTVILTVLISELEKLQSNTNEGSRIFLYLSIGLLICRTIYSAILIMQDRVKT